VLAAVTQRSCLALVYASASLLRDRDFILTAVTRNSDALYWVSDEILRYDSDVLAAASGVV